ncbi:CRTAC1 family protein [Porticoccus sp. W117]|uniref:CRTAC1 family protein n=1 Tax=Porticoccus sp. W117 TaxID=3054777 RepID=UPI002597DB3A|nr:CRTAC1 family protein [Porticoccus sp. W117]
MGRNQLHPEIEDIAGGVAAGDYDNDGLIDLFIVRGDIGPNLLYRNMGNNQFESVADAAGLAYTRSATENYRHSGPTFVDLDGDNDLDLFIGGIQGDPSMIFANNGDGTFSDVTAGSGIDGMAAAQTVSAAFGDYDLDGDLDMFISHWSEERDQNNPGDTENLWRNDSSAGVIRFVSVSLSSGLSPSIINLPDSLVVSPGFDFSFAPTFADVNNDRLPDILSVADFNQSQYFTNNGDGTFSNATDVDVMIDNNGMGSAVADYDNDGDLDWFVSAIYAPAVRPEAVGNRLYRNNNGVFEDITDSAGVADGGWGWASCFVDVENDGDLDIYHTNGWKDTSYAGDFNDDASRVFVNQGDGTFVESALSLGLADTYQGRGAVCADFDNDGDSDIFLWHLDDDNGALLLRNEGDGNNYLKVKLRGRAPNTEAVGARIKVTIAGVAQMREINVGSNFVSQNPTVQLFGLGTASQVDDLVVEWPDGTVSNHGIVQAGQLLELNQP